MSIEVRIPTILRSYTDGAKVVEGSVGESGGSLDELIADLETRHPGLRERLVEIADGGAFILHPGEFVLGSTSERVSLPNDLTARVEGKSSLGRLGLLIHSTAGFVDPGFDGHITLELSNVANLPITIYPGMKIGQISFLRMTTPADNPYGSAATGSKYQNQRGPTPSRYFENFQRD